MFAAALSQQNEVLRAVVRQMRQVMAYSCNLYGESLLQL